MEIKYDISRAFIKLGADISEMQDEELQETLFFIQKIRADIEQGRYDTEDKKWSELERK